MEIHKKLWNWCRRPKRPVSTKFARLATPLYVSVLIGGLVLAAYVAVVLLPPVAFKSSSDESGRVTGVVERVLFPGGAVVVYKHPIYETPEWYISIEVHNYITCEDDLLGYVNSRKNALNELLDLISVDEKLQVTVTFDEALDSTDFRSLYRKYLGDGPYHWAIVVENETSKELESIALNAPNPDYFDEYFPYPKEGLKIISVIAFETLLDADTAKTLRQDPRILLVDPQGCLTIRELIKKYSLKGFKVIVERPPLLIRTFTPEITSNSVNIDELLNNPYRYNLWRLHFVGKISDFDPIENAFFKLNEKLLICYKYYGIDLSEQIAEEDIKNEDYVTVVGTFFQERSTLYADKIEKVRQDYTSALIVDELLVNAVKYDRQTVQVFGRASDLGYLEGPFFRLDGKIMICYIHNDTNLHSQISEVQNGDPMIVTGVFYHDDMILYAENIRPSKFKINLVMKS